MGYGDDDLPAGTWTRHHCRDIVANRVGGGMTALVADERERLIAGTEILGRVLASTADPDGDWQFGMMPCALPSQPRGSAGRSGKIFAAKFRDPKRRRVP